MYYEVDRVHERNHDLLDEWTKVSHGNRIVVFGTVTKLIVLFIVAHFF
jgi:hypothetical protein